ncbi:MAG: flagellar basal body rod C-terminal domain-containing protein [Vampirovibrionales bacterium]|nr:flagellar basal body rod C-terminal domain-containing protein [Vampirovibrionales bacterium]
MSLFDSYDIAASGIQAQSDRMKIHAHNMANVGTPYFKRKVPVLTEGSEVGFNDMVAVMSRDGVLKMGLSASPQGVQLEDAMVDPSAGQKVYQPGHPQADKDGFVEMSNTNVMSDMAGATLASRMYEANIAVIGIVKQMSTKALEIGRGQ